MSIPINRSDVENKFKNGLIPDENDYKLILDYIDSLVGGGTYSGNTPTTITINGIVSGTDISGVPLDDLLENIYAPFQIPVFSSFLMSAQATTIEVGTALSGNKTFLWNITNAANVQPNSVTIRNVTTNTVLASGLANDGTELLPIGTISNIAPMTQSWRAESINTQITSFNSNNFTVSSIYPFFYGKVASMGSAPGINRPIADQTLIDSGTSVVAGSNGTLSIAFGSTSDDYVWFAIPSTSTSKTVWYIDALNNGTIGGVVSPAGNLFPLFDTTSIDSPTVLWNGINYKIYIANYQSAIVSTMQLRNS